MARRRGRECPGELFRGRRLRSERELADRLGVSLATMRRVLDGLPPSRAAIFGSGAERWK